MVKKIIQILISLFVFGLCLFLATLADTNIVSVNFSLKMLIFYIFLIQWLVFVPCFILRTEKIYDLTGSFSYVFAIIFVLYNSSQSIPSLILGAAIIFWAVRLGLFLFFRIKKAGEDKRFKEIKQSPTRFFLAWSLQGMWVSICSLCALTAIASKSGVVENIYFYTGLIIYIAGISIEIIADKQKTRFRSLEKNKDTFITSGLWSKSRHPNYLGEILLWFGISVMSISSLSGFQYITLISPVFSYILIVYVSGVRILEESGREKWGHLDSYKEYIKKTPVLFFKL